MSLATRSPGGPAERIRLIILITLLVLCVAGGGASRTDVLSLVYLRPAALLCLAALLLLPGGLDFRSLRIPLLLLAALALTMLIQLIPLPPGLWESLPARERYAEAGALAGMPDAWRPISLAPDLTLNSLVTLVFPLTVLVAMAGLRPHQHKTLLHALIVAACLSALLGIFQVTGGADSLFYLYAVTHEGSAVGFFANRNHQAVLLALTLPMLKLWTLMPTEDRGYQRTRYWIASATALFLVPMILVTGSRAGMALGLLSLLMAHFLLPRELRAGESRPAWARFATPAAWLAPVGLAIVVILMKRAVAIDRLALLSDPQSELRLQHLPLLTRMVWDFFPVGIGFGSFDPVFRGFESDHTLHPLYFNHAHNDLVELVLTGGLPALLILAAFAIWVARRGYAVLVPLRFRSPRTLFARVGALIIFLTFLASLVDYPLRTPLFAVVFTIACAWLAPVRDVPRARS
ncbi:MAG TPA: O-antigen ligase family protein [Allosphingosinicella sp.]|nr:O-antigen ligase family protein [Allosphingosinicella sp.]